jgi:hypothetical protein
MSGVALLEGRFGVEFGTVAGRDDDEALDCRVMACRGQSIAKPRTGEPGALAQLRSSRTMADSETVESRTGFYG